MAIKSFKPQKVVDTVEDSEYLPEKANFQFFYMHHPSHWHFIEGEWLPGMKKWRLNPGVGGVEKGRNGYRQARTNLEMDGWTVISHDVPVVYHDDQGQLVNDTGYLCSLRGRGGKVYTDVWHTPFILGAGRTARVDWGEGFDREGFNLWRKLLLERGIIARPNQAILANTVTIQRKRVDRCAAKANTNNPYAVSVYERELSMLEGMEASFDKPVKRKTSKKQKVSANV